MDISDINIYFALATFLTPAVIITSMRRVVTPVAVKRFSNDLLNLVMYSVLNILLYIFITKIFDSNLAPITYLLNICVLNMFLGSYFIFTIALPILLGCVICFMDKNNWITNIFDRIFHQYTATSIQTQWEEIFSYAPYCDVVIKLKNGDLIKGNYAGGSGVATDINNKDIFIDNVSYVSGKKCNKTTTAIWVSGNDIVYIIFKNIKYYNKPNEKEN